MTPKVEDAGTHITSLMADCQPPHDAAPQVPSSGEHIPLSNTTMRPATPRLSQLETPPMSDESLIPCPSDSVPESPQNAPAPDACQPVIISDVHSEAQQAILSPQERAEYSVASMDPDSDNSPHCAKYDCESRSPLSVPNVPIPSPLLVPLPESDVEEDHPSESWPSEGATGTAGGRSQNSDAYTSSTGERTAPRNDPDVARPSKFSSIDAPSYVHTY